MPQTYMRAVSPGAAGRPAWLRCRRAGAGAPARAGTGREGAGHGCTLASLSAGSGGAVRTVAKAREASRRAAPGTFRRAATVGRATWCRLISRRVRRPPQLHGQRAVELGGPSWSSSRSSTVDVLARGAARRATATAACGACPRRRTSPRGRFPAPSRPRGGSRCPPLRSALLTTASSTTIRARSGWSLRASRARSTPSSTSTHSWHIPGPNGPSRQHRRWDEVPA